MLSITLDWLAFTFTEDTLDAQDFLHSFASSARAVEITATNGYRTAYKSAQGVVVQWNVDRPEMGYHVIIAGSAIRNVLEYYQLDQKTLVCKVLHAGGRVTRLDLAKDLTGENVPLDKIYQALERGEYSGTARKFAQIHSLGGGNTIYVGSRQSEKFVRIYDKAAESKLSGQLWTRFEVETKGMVARSVAVALCGVATFSDVFDEITRHMVDLPSIPEFRSFYTLGLVHVGIPKQERQTDREAWIEKQVMPAVVTHFVEHPDSKAVALLRAMLDQIERGNSMLDNTTEPA